MEFSTPSVQLLVEESSSERHTKTTRDVTCRREIGIPPFMSAGLGLVPPLRGAQPPHAELVVYTRVTSPSTGSNRGNTPVPKQKNLLFWSNNLEFRSTLLFFHVFAISLHDPKADEVCVMDQVMKNWVLV